MHAKVLTTWPVHHTWQQLSGIPAEPCAPLALTPHEREVPLLLRDPTALLIQFILLLPLHLDQGKLYKTILNYFFYLIISQLIFSLLLERCESNIQLAILSSHSADKL